MWDQWRCFCYVDMLLNDRLSHLKNMVGVLTPLFWYFWKLNHSHYCSQGPRDYMGTFGKRLLTFIYRHLTRIQKKFFGTKFKKKTYQMVLNNFKKITFKILHLKMSSEDCFDFLGKFDPVNYYLKVASWTC